MNTLIVQTPREPAATPEPTTPPAGPSAVPRSRNLTLWTVVAGGLLGIVFTLLCVQWSMAHGRLSQDPTFDDSFYLWDGARRLDTLFRSGLGAFFGELFREPPHAPFSTLGATLAYAVFGVHDWAPYALVNGGVLLALLACVAYLARALGLRGRLLSMGLVLTLPLAVVAVHDFRPDFACALLTAVAIYLTAEAAEVVPDRLTPRARVWRWLAAGVGFGLALLVKPSFFLHTLFMEGWAFLAFTGLHAWISRPFSPPAAIREGLRALAWIVLPSLLVAAPYYLVNAHETYQYFVDRSVGQHGSIWRVPGGVGGLVYYNTFGYAGTTMFGGAFYVVLALYILALAWLIWRRRWQDVAFQGSLLVVAAVSIAVMVAGKLPNPFFPLTAFLLVVFVVWRAIFHALADWLPPAGSRRGPALAAAGLLLLAGLANLSLLRLGRIWVHDNPGVRAVVGRDHSLNARIVADIHRELGVNEARITVPLVGYVTTAGFINSTTLRWLARRDERPIDFFDDQLSDQPDVIRNGIKNAAFVIAPQEHAAGVFQELPSWAIHAQVAQALADEVAAGGLRLLHTYPTLDGGSYQLYVRDEKVAEWVDAFYGVADWEGFLPWEGPYPQAHLGRVRWGIGQHERMTFSPDVPGRALLRFSVRADQPVHGSVSFNGAVVAAIDLPGQTGFHDFRVPVELTANAARLTFDFDRPIAPSGDGIERALLFRQLEVQTAP